MGSVEPKIRVALEYLERKSWKVIITLSETLIKALHWETGTRITR